MQGMFTTSTHLGEILHTHAACLDNHNKTEHW